MTPPLVIEQVNPRDLRPAPWNPRSISGEAFAKLRRGVEKFGLVDPLIVRRSDQMILGGHARHRVALDLEMTTVPVVYIDLEDQQDAVALNILLNNADTQGEYDFRKLVDLLSELDASGYDATVTGFDTNALTRLLVTENPEGEGAQPIDEQVCPRCGHRWKA